MGLCALALETNPVFPSYPNRMAASDVSAGLVLPSAAVALMGKGGAAASLLMVFMAVVCLPVPSLFIHPNTSKFTTNTLTSSYRPQQCQPN